MITTKKRQLKPTNRNNTHGTTHNEMIDLIIKRSGVSKKRIHQLAEADFCLDNIGLLTPAEKKKYKNVISPWG